MQSNSFFVVKIICDQNCMNSNLKLPFASVKVSVLSQTKSPAHREVFLGFNNETFGFEIGSGFSKGSFEFGFILNHKCILYFLFKFCFKINFLLQKKQTLMRAKQLIAEFVDPNVFVVFPSPDQLSTQRDLCV